jgi:hypothetical protein
VYDHDDVLLLVKTVTEPPPRGAGRWKPSPTRSAPTVARDSMSDFSVLKIRVSRPDGPSDGAIGGGPRVLHHDVRFARPIPRSLRSRTPSSWRRSWSPRRYDESVGISRPIRVGSPVPRRSSNCRSWRPVTSTGPHPVPRVLARAPRLRQRHPGSAGTPCSPLQAEVHLGPADKAHRRPRQHYCPSYSGDGHPWRGAGWAKRRPSL